MNALAQVTSQPQPLNHIDAMVRLADEGIPVRAIARSLKTPSDEVYEHLKDAIHQGKIVELPRDDWPPGSSRATRSIFNGTILENEDALKCAIARVFKASRLEGAMLAMMLKRDQTTKEQLHGVVEQNRPFPGTKEMTDIKMVDVIICKLRKKLRDHEVLIETVWGIGYLISAKHRDRCVDLLLRS